MVSPDKIMPVVVTPAFNEQDLIGDTLLGLYNQRGVEQFPTVVVDNASTDNTRNVIDEFQYDHPDFLLHVVEEPQKGTGAACATGFDFAINQLKATIIARTDTDSIPSPIWLAAGVKRLTKHRKKKVVTGPIRPRIDEHYHFSDQYMAPTGEIIGRLAKTALALELAFLKAAPGANTIIKADAYKKVGGYQRTSIDELDEDSDLAIRLREEYGFKVFSYDRKVVVYTSMRRLRAIGLTGMVQSYILHPDNKDVRLRLNDGDVDIR